MTHKLTAAGRCAGAVALVAAALAQGGCSGVGDSFAAAAFVDPAKFANFTCPQLEDQRKAYVVRTAELQKLIDKANTGTGGAVVGEMVYRNDFIATRAQARLVEQTWTAHDCGATTPTDAKPLTPR